MPALIQKQKVIPPKLFCRLHGPRPMTLDTTSTAIPGFNARPSAPVLELFLHNEHTYQMQANRGRQLAVYSALWSWEQTIEQQSVAYNLDGSDTPPAARTVRGDEDNSQASGQLVRYQAPATRGPATHGDQQQQRLQASGQLVRQRAWIRQAWGGEYRMVLDMLALTGIPVTVGTMEGARVAKQEDDEHTAQYRMRDFSLEVYCDSKSRKRDEVNKAIVVLQDGKLYLTQKDDRGRPKPLRISRDDDDDDGNTTKRPHPFTGFYLDFHPSKPESSGPSMFERLDKPKPIRGLVSTIAVEPPTLNWVYVDKATCEVKYGSRAAVEALDRQAQFAAQGRLHTASGVNQIKPSNVGAIVGPWDWTDDEAGLTIDDWEGFVAVEEAKGLWAVYFDRDDDGLAGIVEGKRVLQCSLERRMLDEEEEEQDIHPQRK